MTLSIKNSLKNVYGAFCKYFPPFRAIYDTATHQAPVRMKHYFWQKLLRINSDVPWPMHFSSIANGIQNITIGIDTNPGFMPGCYIQGAGPVNIGDYTQISANVGIISGNHVLTDTRKHIMGEVHIGKYCWIGMNAMILPNVVLGDHTIVGAGAVVTKSFPEGYCVVAGNPAKKIKDIDKSQVVPFEYETPYIGFRPASVVRRQG